MTPRKTALSKSLLFSRSAQIAILNSRFGKRVWRFVHNQILLPLLWIRLLHALDRLHKSWTLSIEIIPYPKSHYHLIFKHTAISGRWSMNYDILWKQEDITFTRTGRESFQDSIEFYQYLLLYLIRIPKLRMEMTFTVGRSVILSNVLGWRREYIETILQQQELEALFVTTPLPIKWGYTVNSNFLIEFLNAKSKPAFIKSIN